MLSENEIGKLLATCKGTDFISRRDFAILSLMLDTGIRRGELAGMKVGDLDLGQMVAFIEASTSKSRRGRAVALGPTTAKAITRYLRHPKAPRDPSRGGTRQLQRTGVQLNRTAGSDDVRAHIYGRSGERTELLANPTRHQTAEVPSP